jgi:hypothetical protein
LELRVSLSFGAATADCPIFLERTRFVGVVTVAICISKDPIKHGIMRIPNHWEKILQRCDATETPDRVFVECDRLYKDLSIIRRQPVEEMKECGKMQVSQTENLSMDASPRKASNLCAPVVAPQLKQPLKKVYRLHA